MNTYTFPKITVLRALLISAFNVDNSYSDKGEFIERNDNQSIKKSYSYYISNSDTILDGKYESYHGNKGLEDIWNFLKTK